RLEGPAPALLVDAVGFHRTWCLPPGMAPLAMSHYRRLPGPEGDRGPRLPLPDHFALLSPLVGSGYLEEWQAEQERVIDEAGRALAVRPADAKAWTLGEALDHLAFEQRRGQTQLGLDITALHEAGLGQESVLPPEALRAPSGSPWWHGLGLVYVPCRGAPLLTTRLQW